MSPLEETEICATDLTFFEAFPYKLSVVWPGVP